MSKENVGTVRGMLEAVQQRDFDEAEGYFDPKVEWNNTSTFPGPRTIVGPKAIFAFWKELFQNFQGAGEAEVEDLNAGGDRVVLGLHTQGRGHGSGVPVNVRWALIFRFRDGKIVQVDVRGDYSKALEAAGLSEQAMSQENAERPKR
jgi:ketosteroid isomerase-like protein